MAGTSRRGLRSSLEDKVAEQLDEAGVDYGYESITLSFVQPEKARRYTPDFILRPKADARLRRRVGKGQGGRDRNGKDNRIYIEVKGKFDSADRQKMKLVKQQYPDLDIRFVFGRAHNKISKRSKTTYAMWADRNGFPWADKGVVPSEWIS